MKSTVVFGIRMEGPDVGLRVRVDEFKDPLHVWYWKGRQVPNQPYPGVSSHYDYDLTASASQELLVTQENAVHQLGKSSKRDIGGPFLCVRREYEEASSPVRRYRSSNQLDDSAYNYLGSYSAEAKVVTDDNFPAPLMPDAAEMLAAGTTAIARCIPSNPLNSLLTTLGEIRAEGLPSAIGSATWRDRAFNARNAGREYLNYEFGWRPLVNDVRNFASTVKRADELVKQYERNAGRLIHRSYTFPEEIERVETDQAAWPEPYYVVGFWVDRGVKHVSTTVKSKTWFEGAFTYHIPKGLLGDGWAAKANHLYGTRLTPDVLWNLTPWSWAVDWFTNVGDVIHNVSAFLHDGLAMPYAYIMRESMVERRAVLTGQRTKYPPLMLEPLEQVFTTTVKARLGATPFGFGLKQSDLSDRQLAIIGALGLSRGDDSSARFD